MIQNVIICKNLKFDANNRFWIAQMQLFVGVWQGNRENRTGYWLRWWDENDNLLLWGSEKASGKD